jgi:hypothetical protein
MRVGTGADVSIERKSKRIAGIAIAQERVVPAESCETKAARTAQASAGTRRRILPISVIANANDSQYSWSLESDPVDQKEAL